MIRLPSCWMSQTSLGKHPTGERKSVSNHFSLWLFLFFWLFRLLCSSKAGTRQEVWIYLWMVSLGSENIWWWHNHLVSHHPTPFSYIDIGRSIDGLWHQQHHGRFLVHYIFSPRQCQLMLKLRLKKWPMYQSPKSAWPQRLYWNLRLSPFRVKVLKIGLNFKCRF